MDGVGTNDLVRHGVRSDRFTFTPPCVPALQIDRVGPYADKDTIVKIGAVAAEAGSHMGGVCLSDGLHTLTGGQEKQTRQNKYPSLRLQ